MAIVKLDKDNFDGVLEKNEIVVIDFWAQWCKPCLAFAPIFESVSNKYPDIVFAKLNTEEETELAADFNIRSIPTIAILRQKIMVFCEAGLLPAVALEDLIKQAQSLDMQEVKKNLGE